MHVANFTEDHGGSCRARLGMIILSVDETIESDFAKYFPWSEGVTVYHARAYKGPSIDVHDLNATRGLIARASSLLPSFPMDTIGFACTSDAAVLGPAAIAELVASTSKVAPGAVTNPLTAAIRALRALQVRSVAVLTPYTADVTALLATRFESAGITIVALASFNQTSDAVVARIAPGSVLAAVKGLAASASASLHSPVDAVFVSCTQTRTLGVIAQAERALGIPVVSSNSAMAWDMRRLAGLLTPDIQRDMSAFGGRLFSAPVQGQGPRPGHQCP